MFQGCVALQPGENDLERAEDFPHQQADADRSQPPQGHSGKFD